MGEERGYSWEQEHQKCTLILPGDMEGPGVLWVSLCLPSDLSIPFLHVQFCCVLQTGSHSVGKSGLELRVWARLASDLWQFSFLSLPSLGVHRHGSQSVATNTFCLSTSFRVL